MVAAFRKTVTVGPGGRVEVPSSGLQEGELADVIVLVGRRTSIDSKLAALDQLQKSLTLDEAKARQWIDQARRERESIGQRE
jgi:hypothetical protein